MPEQLTLQPSLTVEDLVIGFMRFAQEKRNVKDFPLFPDPSWQLFLYYTKRCLKHLLPAGIEMHFEWDGPYPKSHDTDELAFVMNTVVVGMVDLSRRRMTLDLSGPWGMDFDDHFPQLAEKMFSIAGAIGLFSS